MAKFARMGGYKNTSVASTTWYRIRHHLQKIAPVEGPGPSADMDNKKRKRDEDGDEEDEVLVKKRGKVVKAVGSDDELASEGGTVGASSKGTGGKGKGEAVGNGLTPDGDSQEETCNCITVKGSDGEDGPAEGKKDTAKRGSKARGAIGWKRKKDTAASDKAVENGAGEGGGGPGTGSGAKKGKPERDGGDASASKADEAEDSDTVDEDAIVAKGEKEVHAQEVDEPHGDVGAIEVTPAGEGSKSKDTKAGGVDVERAKGAAYGDSDVSAGKVKGPAEKDSDCIKAVPIEEASYTKKSKPTKAIKGKLATGFVLVEAASVKKSGRVKATKATKGDAKPKKGSKNAGHTEGSLVLDAEKGAVNNDEDAGFAKDLKVGAASIDGSAPVKRSRQAKRSKDGSTSSSVSGKLSVGKSDGVLVEETQTTKEEDKLGFKYIIDHSQGAGVILDSQDSEKA